MPVRFSLHSVHGGVKDINEIYDRAQRAEAPGFEGIFLGESHVNSLDSSLATDYLVQRFFIAGTPEECIARVKELE